jgi:hypothetical protein
MKTQTYFNWNRRVSFVLPKPIILLKRTLKNQSVKNLIYSVQGPKEVMKL